MAHTFFNTSPGQRRPLQGRGRRSLASLAGVVIVGSGAVASCGGSDGDLFGSGSESTTPAPTTITGVAPTPGPTPGPTSNATTTTETPYLLPELGPESAVGAGMPDGTYAATINTEDAPDSRLGLNLVSVGLVDGVPVATDEDPLGLADLSISSATEILLVPVGGGGLQSATPRQLWNTMGKKDTGFDVRDSSVLFFTVEGGAITRVEQQPYIAVS